MWKAGAFGFRVRFAFVQPLSLLRRQLPYRGEPLAKRLSFPTCQSLPSVGATTTTAASGGNRESLLGPRPARRKQSAADAGCRNPGSGTPSGVTERFNIFQRPILPFLNFSAAAMKPLNRGCARLGRLLNSGWNCAPRWKSRPGSSTVSTRRPSGLVPEMTRPAS